MGAQWLVKLQEYISQSPHIIVNGFIASGITPSLDSGKPIFDNKDTAENDIDDNLSNCSSDMCATDNETDDEI